MTKAVVSAPTPITAPIDKTTWMAVASDDFPPAAAASADDGNFWSPGGSLEKLLYTRWQQKENGSISSWH